MEIFTAATFLQVKGIIDQCYAYLGDPQIFFEDSAFLMYLEAEKYNCELKEQIQHLMSNRISKFFLSIVASTSTFIKIVLFKLKKKENLRKLFYLKLKK